MVTPAISFILATVRGDRGYAGRDDLHTIGTVVEDLKAQTFQDFELIVVDGLQGQREYCIDSKKWAEFRCVHVPPRETLWTKHKKVAICGYRNTGLTYASGELVINLDDCCRLPPTYAETFWLAYKRGYCAAMTWPRRNDNRRLGIVTGPGYVFGFGSFPLAAAIELNAYDESYDGSQGLEDIDWSTRLFNIGVKQVLLDIEGFDILDQTGHDPRAIDLARPLERCCNQSWQTQRVQRQVRVANRPELWTREWVEKIIGPCQYRFDGTPVICKHHNLPCPYVDRGFVFERTWFHEQLLEHPPVFDLVQARAEVKR